MRRTLSYFFLVLVHTCCGNHPGIPGRSLRHDFRNDTTIHEKLRYLELIKKKIEQTLGIHGSPITDTKEQPREPNQSQVQPLRYKLPQVASYYSEPPDNFTDENILQFRLQSDSQGKRVEVNNVKLFVRIKMNKNKKERSSKPKREILTKEERQGRRKRRKRRLMKEITLVVLKVNADGTPGDQVTRETTKIRKTKFLRLTLPKEEIQKAIDSNKKTVQYFVKCIGCDKKARMITTSKKRRVTRQNSNLRNPPLMKRRPFMILQTHIVSGKRN